MSEEELKVIEKYYSKLSQTTQNYESLQQSHSIDEAAQKTALKKCVENEIVNMVKKEKL